LCFKAAEAERSTVAPPLPTTVAKSDMDKGILIDEFKRLKSFISQFVIQNCTSNIVAVGISPHVSRSELIQIALGSPDRTLKVKSPDHLNSEVISKVKGVREFILMPKYVRCFPAISVDFSSPVAVFLFEAGN